MGDFFHILIFLLEVILSLFLVLLLEFIRFPLVNILQNFISVVKILPQTYKLFLLTFIFSLWIHFCWYYCSVYFHPTFSLNLIGCETFWYFLEMVSYKMDNMDFFVVDQKGINCRPNVLPHTLSWVIGQYHCIIIDKQCIRIQMNPYSWSNQSIILLYYFISIIIW